MRVLINIIIFRYGSFLRRVREEGFLRNGIGIDFSAKMCQQCEINNTLAKMSDVIEIRNESFLDMSVEDESIDVVISMDAFYHVGAERHYQVFLSPTIITKICNVAFVIYVVLDFERSASGVAPWWLASLL